jgi:bifunctional UDP-N-acetylglucosamine pyrophosphorylase/glucosamine-1-phosphate N-acetyltransferase
LEDTTLEDGSNFGPMSRGRGGAVIGENVHIGNFAEIKNSTVGKGTKIGHVSYTGDATLGENVNIGAGMIICNYDGVKKYHTDIGNNAFVGSNTTIISPCNIENDTFIAGGSTITKHVKKYDLAVGRARQENIEGWVKKRKVVAEKETKKTTKKDKDK